MDVFDFAIYFAAWVKSEVAVSKRVYKDFDEAIEQCVHSCDSLQEALVRIVEIIGYDTFLVPFS